MDTFKKIDAEGDERRFDILDMKEHMKLKDGEVASHD